MLPRFFFKKNITTSLLDPDEILMDSASALSSPYSTETKIERPITRWGAVFFLFLVLAGWGYLVWRATSLQIGSGSALFAKSQENRFSERPLFPPRGIIFDRFKDPLVDNEHYFGLLFDKRPFFRARGEVLKVKQGLMELLGVSEEFLDNLGFPPDNDPQKLPATIILSQNLPLELLVRLASRLDEIPGVQIFEGYRRVYENPRADAHLLGFIGKVSEEDLVQNPELGLDDMAGKSGLELYYDNILRGKGGKKIVEVDSAGRETRYRLTVEPQSGTDLVLTVDGALQHKAYETLQHYTASVKGASIVVIDPRNGAVRALISSPSFDSNRFGSSLSQKEFNAVLQNPLRPFFNRAIAGEFPSGSTIKPIIAASALEEKIIDPEQKIYDEGFIEIPNPYKPGEKSVFVDWKKHGWINFYDAIAQSANVYFYMIGGGYKNQRGLGIEKIKKYALAFGLGSKLGIDLPGEKSGFFPDPETKKITEPQDPFWRVGDTYNVSIGQGSVKVTPLQMTAATAALANGGKLFQPHLLDGSGRLIRDQIVSAASIREVARGMRQTVTSGTARLLNGLPVAAAAKTGTAQAGSGLPHAWVTVFAPVENPEIAITVMVEHAGEGATVAVPITHDILQWYFQNRKLSTVD